MDDDFPQTLSGYTTFTCINESLSLIRLISQAVGTHFIWEEAEIVFLKVKNVRAA